VTNTTSYTTRSETGLLKTGPEIWSLYVYSNLRLLEKIQAVSYVETTVEWEQRAGAVADSDSK